MSTQASRVASLYMSKTSSKETWRLKSNAFNTVSQETALDELDADCVRAGLSCQPDFNSMEVTVEGSPSIINKVMSSASWKRKVEKVANTKTSSGKPGVRMNDDIFLDMDGRPVKVNSLDDVIHVPSGLEGFPYEMSGYGSDTMVLISNEFGDEEKLVPAIEVRKVRNLKKLRSFKDRYRNTGKVGDKVVLTPKGGTGLRKKVVGVVEMIFTEDNDPEVMVKLRGVKTEFPAKLLTMYDKYVELFGKPKMASKTAASGHYGFTKRVQNDVEVALRKLQKKVDQLARIVENKYPEAGTYFETRCQGTNCNASKVLSKACLLNQAPKRVLSGPLGHKPTCVRASHKAITDLILHAGEIAHTLYKKDRDHIPYLQTHAKKKRCPLTKLILENYPVEIL